MFQRNTLHKLLGSILAIISLNLTACEGIKPNLKAISQEKPKIVASHSVLCGFITILVEDTVDLTCLIEPGQDPHTYNPTPSQRKAMEEAQLILYGGYDLEPKIIQLIVATDTPTPKIPVYEEVVQQPIMSEHEHHEEGEEEEEEEEELTADPHIWHDTNNAIAIVEYLQSVLLQINPNEAELYLKNSVNFTEQIAQLRVWIQDQINTIPEGKRILITTHDSLNYYVRAYKLEGYQKLQGLSTEDSPSASDLRNLVTSIRQTGVPTIFAETTGRSDRVINSVAREAGVTVSKTPLLTDGLSKSGTNTDTYIKMMINNTCAITDGLGGKCSPFNNGQLLPINR